MSKIKILVVEDEAIYAQQLEMLIEELGHQSLGIVDNGKDALEMVFATHPDLILMDIHLEGATDGIHIAEKINEQYDIPIIFITSLNDETTFNRAKFTRPVAFLTKPFSPQKLQRTMELVILRLPTKVDEPPTITAPSKIISGKECFFVKIKNTLEKIIVKDILWIEVLNRDCSIVTKEKTLQLRIPLKELIEKLPSHSFVRTHRSFIANIHHIDAIDLTAQKVIIGQQKILLSKTHREHLLQRLELL